MLLLIYFIYLDFRVHRHCIIKPLPPVPLKLLKLTIRGISECLHHVCVYAKDMTQDDSMQFYKDQL
jgi:hypothetical protein